MPDVRLISSATLEVLRNIPTQTLIDGLWVMGWPMSFIHGAKPLQPGQHMAGRAVTLRFVPHRPDLVADNPRVISRLNMSPSNCAVPRKSWSLMPWAGNTAPSGGT